MCCSDGELQEEEVEEMASNYASAASKNHIYPTSKGFELSVVDGYIMSGCQQQSSYLPSIYNSALKDQKEPMLLQQQRLSSLHGPGHNRT